MVPHKRRWSEDDYGGGDVGSDVSSVIEVDEDDEVWDVSRILAERVGADGVKRFLVLWEGFPEEAASWEPADNFTTTESLNEWEQQKAAGDLLDDKHLAEVEARIEAYNKRLLADHVEDAQASEPPEPAMSSNSPESRPAKRPKPAPPQLSKHIAQPPSKKSKAVLTKPPVVNKTPINKLPMNPPQTMQSIRPQLGPAVDAAIANLKASAAKAVASRTQGNTPASQLYPTTPKSTATKLANVQKPNKTTPPQPRPMTPEHRFRNLQHMGNARKKAAQERPVDPDDPKLVMISREPAPHARSPSAESALFFPEVEVVQKPVTIDQEKAAAASTVQEAVAQPELSLVRPDREPVKPSVLIRRLLTNPKCKITARSSEQDSAGKEAIDPGDEVFTSPDLPSKARPEVIKDGVTGSAQEPPGDHAPTDRDLYQPRHPIHEDRGRFIGEEPKAPGSPVSEISVFSAAEPPIQSAPSLGTLRGKNGLSWAADELVVHLSLGNYDIGPVKLVGFPVEIRSALIRYKRDFEAYEIKIHFAQERVLEPADFRSAARDFVDSGHHTATIIPFPQSARVCEELSRDYLVSHDLSAVWILQSAPLAFVLYSPNSSSWLAQNKYKRPNGYVDLKMKAYRLLPSALPVNPPDTNLIGTKSCLRWAAGFCSFGGGCWFRHDSHEELRSQEPHSTVSRRPPPGRLQTVDERGLQQAMTRDEGQGLITVKGTATLDGEPSDLRGATFRRRKSMSGVQQADMNRESGESARRITEDDGNAVPSYKQVSLANEKVLNAVHNSNIAAVKVKHDRARSPMPIDWSVDLDWDGLLSALRAVKTPAKVSSKSTSVFIGLPQTFSEQAEAISTWAKQYTDPSLVCGRESWRLFSIVAKHDNNPKLFFFHESAPLYATLDEMNTVLAKPGVLCYNISWDTSSGKARYMAEPLLERGQAVLLSEEVMVSTPTVALALLQWFHDMYKDRSPEHYKMMVRPSVVDWLTQHVVAVAEVDPKQVQVFVDMLEIIHKLAGGPFDVTKPGMTEMSAFAAHVAKARLVAMPAFGNKYDHSATAPMDIESVRKRDEFLTEYFIGFATVESVNFKRFLVLHGGNAVQPSDGQHVSFRSAAGFVDGEILGKGKK